MMSETKLVPSLGWFSVGLGLSQLAAPKQLSTAIGIGEKSGVMRALGARELSSGIAILSRRKPVAGLWSRVAGDAMDIAMLAIALGSPDTEKRRATGALLAVLGIAVADVYGAIETTSRISPRKARERAKIIKTTTVGAPREEMFAFWRRFENVARLFPGVNTVERSSENRWRVGTTEIDAQAIETIERLEWQLVTAPRGPKAIVSLYPATGGRGTVIRVEVDYGPHGMRSLGKIAKLVGEIPGDMIATALRRYKQLAETGEVLTIHGQTSGRAA